MSRQLKLWNGRPSWAVLRSDSPEWTRSRDGRDAHMYVAAYSVADLRRMCEAYTGHDPGSHEITQYWSADCWGLNMDGVVPKRGIWVVIGYGHEPPVLLYDGEKT